MDDLSWLVEEIIDSDHVTYWLHGDHLDAELHALTVASERQNGSGRILVLGPEAPSNSRLS